MKFLKHTGPSQDAPDDRPEESEVLPDQPGGGDRLDPDAIKSTVIEYTCSKNCYGVKENFGGCCTIRDRDFIIGPIKDHKRFLRDLSRKLGRKVRHDEVFIDSKEGRKLFPDKTSWLDKTHYPALRVVTELEDMPCRFYDMEKKQCTVYEIRPQTCREYYCDHLDKLIELL